MKKRRAAVYAALISALAATILLALAAGSARIKLPALLHGAFGREGYEMERVIFLSIRLPRVLAALIAGAGLSLSGVLLQTVMANPLAGPNIIGVNAGAGFAVILMLSLFPQNVHALPVAAFVGAFCTALAILRVARRIGAGRNTVVLAGMGCTALFQAGISFLSTLDAEVLASYNAFSVGGFSGVSLAQLTVPGLIVLACLLVALCFSGHIAALSLGDAVASSLGVRANRMRVLCLLLASACAAAVVSYAGLLGFAGLIVPHIARRLNGANVRSQLCTAPLAGAVIVILSDLVGRSFFAPSEVSAGVIMAFIGAPCFFALLLRGRRNPDA